MSIGVATHMTDSNYALQFLKYVFLHPLYVGVVECIDIVYYIIRKHNYV